MRGFVDAAFGTGPDLARSISDGTAGNALFVREMVRQVRSRAGLSPSICPPACATWSAAASLISAVARRRPPPAAARPTDSR